MLRAGPSPAATRAISHPLPAAQNGIEQHTHLRNRKQIPRHLDDRAHLADAVDPVLDGLRVVGSSRIQHVADAPDLCVGPLFVQRAAELSDCHKHRQQTDRHDSLFVDDVQLVGDGPDRRGGGRRQDGCLGDERAARETVEEGLRFGFGVHGRR